MPTPSPAPRPYRLLRAGNVALVSAAVVIVTTVAVWLLGLGQHRTLFANSLISTSLLFAAFFLFTAVGLYHGVKLRDDVGRLTDRISRKHFPRTDFSDLNFSGPDLHLDADGLVGFLLALLTLLVAAVVALFVIWLVGALLWTGILIFAAMLY